MRRSLITAGFSLLTLVVFLPSIGALLLALPIFTKDRPDAMRYFSLAVTIVVFLLTVLLAVPSGGAGFTVECIIAI